MIDKFPAPELNVMVSAVLIDTTVDVMCSELVLNVIGLLVVKFPTDCHSCKDQESPTSVGESTIYSQVAAELNVAVFPLPDSKIKGPVIMEPPSGDVVTVQLPAPD